MKLIKSERISLKNSPYIKESDIQEFIFNDPTVLGLGDLSPIQREKIQPSGGRLDILLTDDNNSRYEVEVQLGATDPSHIIRTIEYWDTERKRYPQYDHCAVIVAEEITGRFMNVISLFNGSIPLIAFQMSAFQEGDNIRLTFTRVIDRIEYADDAEEDYAPADRAYWENKSSPKILKEIDKIFANLGEIVAGYGFKYNKYYIGISKDGIVRNAVKFYPRKNYLYLCTKSSDGFELKTQLENEGLEVSYNPRWNDLSIKLQNLSEYEAHKDAIDRAIKASFEHFENA